MSVSYARSAEDNALFALAISTKGQVKDQNGLDVTTAISVNCKTAIFTSALGFEVEETLEIAQLIAGSFCFMRKKHWIHSFW